MLSKEATVHQDEGRMGNRVSSFSAYLASTFGARMFGFALRQLNECDSVHGVGGPKASIRISTERGEIHKRKREKYIPRT